MRVAMLAVRTSAPWEDFCLMAGAFWTPPFGGRRWAHVGTRYSRPFGVTFGARFGATALLVLLLATACDFPTLREARQEAAELPQTSFVYASNGQLITRLHAGEDRVVVRARRIPDVVRNAVIAIEDQRFYDHAGLDLRAVLRAAYVNATSGRVVEGGSTITQQYVRNAFPSVGKEQTVARKVKEAALAWELEKRYSKDQILGKYLNTVYFGQGAYGILRAAKVFFSKTPDNLRLAEAAVLAGG